MKPTEPAVCSMASRWRATLGTVGEPGSVSVTVTVGSAGASGAGVGGCACAPTQHDAVSSARHAARAYEAGKGMNMEIP